MRSNFTLLAKTCFIVFILGMGCQNPNDSESLNAPPEEQLHKKVRRSQEIGYMEFLKTADPRLERIPKEKIMDAMHYRDAMNQRSGIPGLAFAPVPGVTWNERGPSNVSGRIRGLLVDRSDPTGNTVLVGGVGGGIWRSTNALAATPTWNNIDDFFDNIAISTIAQDPSNLNNIYFGTGEGWFNVDAIQGLGIWQSTDGGLTYNQLASTNNASFFYVQKIVVDNAGNIFAATRNAGLQFSNDGGTTFNNILTIATTINTMANQFPNVRVADIEIAPNGNIFAALGIGNTDGIYRSTDGGANWTYLHDGANGLPTTGFERIELAVAPSNSNRLYAIFEGAFGTPTSNQCSGFFTSTDGGNTWTSQPIPMFNDQGTVREFTRGQAWYDLIAAVDPNNEQRVFIGGVDLLVSNDAGANFTQISRWSAATPLAVDIVHADHHAIEFLPGSSDTMYFGTDGGFWTVEDGSMTPPSFSFQSNDINITQFYSCDIDQTAGSNIFIGGTQDNGTQYFTGPGINVTTEVNGGDGAFSHIDADDPSIQISATTYNRYDITDNFWIGAETAVNFPLQGRPNGFFINPTDYDSDNNVMFGSYRTQWYTMITGVGTTNVPDSGMVPQITNGALISAVKVSPNVNDRVYFGTTQQTSNSVVATAAGGQIIRVDNASTAAGGMIAGVNISPPGIGYVSCIEVEEGNENHILMCYSNYGVNSVYETTDGGTSWTSIEGNLPDIPIRWIVFYPGAPFAAFVGTDLGVWSTDFINGGSTVWGSTSIGLANTRVDMICVRPADNTFLAATHGRGMFSSVIPPFSNLALAKTFDSLTAEPNGLSRAWFTITACNLGLDTLDNVQVRDSFPFPIQVCNDPGISGFTITGDDDGTFGLSFITLDPQYVTTGMTGNGMAPGDCDTFTVSISYQPHTMPAPAENYATGTATGRMTGLTVTDSSNVGSMAFPDSTSATDFYLSSIDVVKWIDTTYLLMPPSDSVGNFLVRYKIKMANTGNVDLTNVTLYDNLDDPNLLGTGYMASMGQPSFTVVYPPVFPIGLFNPAYDGIADDSIFLSSAGLFIPAGDSIVFCMSLMVNPNATGAPDTLFNQAIATGQDPTFGVVVFDTSDFGRNELTDNGSGTCSDPTPLNLVDINISKQVLSTRPYNQGANPGEVVADFQLLVKNKGDVPIYDIMVVDSIVANLGATLLSILSPPALVPPEILHGAPVAVTPASVPPTIMPFDKVIDGSAEDDTLNRDEFLDIRYSVLTNPNALANADYATLTNQAFAMGDSPIGMTSDTSDSGWDPENRNAGALGDTGTERDPTPVPLPIFNIAKDIEKVRRPASGTPGNFDAIYRIYFENTGNTPLDNILLQEDLMAAFGPYFVTAISVTIENSTAAVPPPANPGYTGIAPNHNLTTATAATMVNPGETFEVVLIVEIDPDAGGPVLCDTLRNQIVGTAQANDNMGNPILDAMLMPMTTYDTSDAGTDPEGFNPDNFADRGTANDTTLLPDCWKDEPTCQDMVNISLGPDCQILLDAGMFLNGVSRECIDLCFWEIKISDYQGRPVPNPVPGEYAGQILTVTVRNIVTENSCWSKAKIEEKQPPTIVCRNDTISCLHMGERADLIVLADNCMYGEPQRDILEQQWTDLGCEDREFIGYLSRKVRATDLWGNYNECRDTLWVWKEVLDSLICPEDTALACNLQHGNVDVLWKTGANGYTYLDAEGYAHPWPTDARGIAPAPYLKSIDPDQADGYMIPMKTDSGPVFDNGGKCHIVFKYKDHVIPTCGKAYKIRREWIISDWCAKRDTTCIQWIKITDELPPVIDTRYFVPDNDPDLGPWLIEDHDLKATVDAHDCKAHVALEDIRNLVERRTGIAHPDGGWAKECDDDLKLYYELEYADPTHPGKKVVIQENYDDKQYLYLPAGYYVITWRLQDQCWNESRVRQKVWVFDETPPVPVCDEITQVTLDPEACWARIDAIDLDDGSHDNCCDRLHFAVAQMDSINHWRKYWTDYFIGCLDPYDYQHYHSEIEQAIEEWINIFVFDDYVDLTECGEENLVLRVYEACDMPPYDPHVFYGGKHEWYWWNLSDKFAGWYYWRLNEYLHYGDPRASFSCDLITAALPVAANGDGGFSPVQWDYPVDPLHCPTPITEAHGGKKSPICKYLFESSSAENEWKQRVQLPYPSEVSILEGLSEKKRYEFPHLYSDCMIEVIKDDKTPPVCKAPADVTYYCDGVPYHWIIPVGVDQVQGWGASYAHDVCYESDVIRSNCELDKTPVQVWDVRNGGTDKLSKLNGTIANPARWCVAVPWNGGEHGYYGGPTDGYYTEDCDSKPWGVTGMVYDYDWKPIYCRVWLLLDQYDLGDASGKPDPKSYFGEVEYSDNCWVDEPTYEDSGSLNECGVGVLTRTWTVKDKCENQSVCYQRVVIKPRSDFEVVFPPDVEVNCNELEGLDPDIAGRPIVSDDDCELIGINYVDERFTITADGCYKILRTWTLIDWCVYDPDQHFRHPDVIVDDRVLAGEDRGCVYRHLKDDGDGYMIYLQVIKVVDEEAPEVTCTAPQVICNYDEDCEPEVLELDFGSATDNCALADEIAYRYIIKVGQSEDSGDWLYGHGNTHSGALPFGIHDVYLIATDRCGNEDTCTTQVAINDCKRPTPYCYDGVATVVMPSSQSVEVWAKDLDAGSFDNCTEQENLYFTFDAAGLESSRVFTCADIPDGKMEQIEVEIYVWDEAGNVDKCVTYILLQDGSGDVCEDQIIAANPGAKEMGLSMSGQGKVQKSGSDQGSLDIREVVGQVELFQNRPNPFRNETEIGFYLPKAQQVVIRVYNVNGQTVAMHEGNYAQGLHTWRYQQQKGTGLLYYQLQTESKILTKKMVRVE